MKPPIMVPPIMNNRRTTPTAVSEKLRSDSRVNGAVFQEIMDVECVTDGCDRIFVQRMEGQEHCIKHRVNQQ